jgi:peptidoglycan-N-acetylglucosamine deacetylase
VTPLPRRIPHRPARRGALAVGLLGLCLSLFVHTSCSSASIAQTLASPGAVVLAQETPAVGAGTPEPSPVPSATPEPAPTETPAPEPVEVPTPVPTAAPGPRVPAIPARVERAVDISRGVTSRRSVALTFDAGADRGYAEYILDVLLYTGVKASFGMTGVWAEQHPDLVQRMAQEGHRFINHSYDHLSFTGFSTTRRPLSVAQRHAQLERTERLLLELTGESTLPLFRTPYGDTDGTVLRDLAAAGYAYNILWTVDSRGWMGYTVGQIIDRCLRLAEPGAIYVFHVGVQAKDGPALPTIIEGLRRAGYSFETVDEILSE